MVQFGVVLLVTACSPVLSREVMQEGTRDVSFNKMREAPENYRGKLFIFGGIIANTRVTEAESEIEAVFVSVDSYGSLIEGSRMQGRFLAILSRSNGMLDPIVYAKGREITLAGYFRELKKGKIDEMDYDFPVFEVKQIYLWKEPGYYPAAYYYYPYYYPYIYNHGAWPYPDPYWPPPPW